MGKAWSTVLVALILLWGCGSDSVHVETNSTVDPSHPPLLPPSPPPPPPPPLPTNHSAVVVGQKSVTSIEAIESGLHFPSDVLSDGKRLFIVDRLNDRVLIYRTQPTSFRQAPDLVLGQPSPSNTGCNSHGLNASSLCQPTNVAISGERIAVSDTFNNRVLIWNRMPEKSGTPADIVLGQSVFTENFKACAANKLDNPVGLAFGVDHLFVSDYANHRVMAFNLAGLQSGSSADFVLGQKNFLSCSANQAGGVGAGTLFHPLGLHLANNRLSVVDTYNNRVLFFSPVPKGFLANANAVLGQPNLVSQGVNYDGQVLSGNVVNAIGFDRPQAVAVEPVLPYRVFVSEGNNNRVKIYPSVPVSCGSPTSCPTPLSATQVIGQLALNLNKAYTLTEPEADPVTASSVYKPLGLSFDGSSLWIGSYTGRVARWSGIPTTFAPSEAVLGQLDFGSDLPMPPSPPGARTLRFPRFSAECDGRWVVADSLNHRVLVYPTIPKVSYGGATIVLGQSSLTGNAPNAGGVSARSLYNPTAVLCAEKRLIVSDSLNHRVLIWNSVPTESFQSADVVIGQATMTENFPGVSSGRFTRPHALEYDGRYLYVVDHDNHRVMIFDGVPNKNGGHAVRVIGQSDFSGDLPGFGSARLNQPLDVSVDGNRIFVADAGNHRVLVWSTLPDENGSPSDFILGQSTPVANLPNQGKAIPSADTLNSPHSVLSVNGKLYVADYGNHRILIWNSLPLAMGAPADGLYGQPEFNSAIRHNGGVSATRIAFPNALSISADRTRLFISEGTTQAKEDGESLRISPDRVLIIPTP